MNDTISKDPRAIAEAAEAAAFKPAPAIFYNTRHVFAEEFEKLVPKTIDTSVERAWRYVEQISKEYAKSEVVLSLSEDEYRQTCRSFLCTWVAAEFEHLSRRHLRLAHAHRELLMQQLHARMDRDVPMDADLVHGCYRKTVQPESSGLAQLLEALGAAHGGRR